MSVPNSASFGLLDVINEVGLTIPSSLQDCFTHARTGGFDPAYEGSKDRLSNFRNYTHAGAESSGADFVFHTHFVQQQRHHRAFLLSANRAFVLFPLERGTGTVCQAIDMDTDSGIFTPLYHLVPFASDNQIIEAVRVTDSLVYVAWNMMHRLIRIASDGQIDFFLTSATQYSSTSSTQISSTLKIDASHVLTLWKISINNSKSGRAQMFHVNDTNGTITPLATEYEFHPDITFTSVLWITSSKCMVFWTGVAPGGWGEGYCQIWDLNASTGAITPLLSPHVFQETATSVAPYRFDSIKLDDTTVIHSWVKNGGGDFHTQLFTIDTTTGSISDLGPRHSNVINPNNSFGHSYRTIQLDDQTIMFCFGDGVSQSGSTHYYWFAKIFSIDKVTGTITPIGDQLTVDFSNNSFAKATDIQAFKVNSSTIANFYSVSLDQVRKAHLVNYTI
ncbi:MAG: hypothetical protein JXR03_19975 [Cyclobacteriaceae bacterium]